MNCDTVSDGGRACPELAEGSGWGCKKDYQASLPLSCPVQGEEIKSRSDLHRLRTHRLHSTIIFLSLVLFLAVSAHAFAQLKKIRLCAPGLGSGIMHAYVAGAFQQPQCFRCDGCRKIQ